MKQDSNTPSHNIASVINPTVTKNVILHWIQFAVDAGFDSAELM
jgi:hypothetical protein